MKIQEKKLEFIRTKLELAEKSGFTSDTKEQILQQAKALLNKKTPNNNASKRISSQSGN